MLFEYEKIVDLAGEKARNVSARMMPQTSIPRLPTFVGRSESASHVSNYKPGS
jgi:hypothetical protein